MMVNKERRDSWEASRWHESLAFFNYCEDSTFSLASHG